jgi:hypothetical protein
MQLGKHTLRFPTPGIPPRTPHSIHLIIPPLLLPPPPTPHPPAEAEKFLLSESALEDIDLTDDTYALAANKSNKEIDFDALLEARMLDEVRGTPGGGGDSGGGGGGDGGGGVDKGRGARGPARGPMWKREQGRARNRLCWAVSLVPYCAWPAVDV